MNSLQLQPRHARHVRSFAGIVLVGATMASLARAQPIAVPAAETLTVAQKAMALNFAAGYRETYLRKLPIDACTVRRVLGQAPDTLLPERAPLRLAMRGDASEGCELSNFGNPGQVHLISVRRDGIRVIVTAAVYAESSFIEEHTLVLTSGGGGLQNYYHQSVCQRDFVFR